MIKTQRHWNLQKKIGVILAIKEPRFTKVKVCFRGMSTINRSDATTKSYGAQNFYGHDNGTKPVMLPEDAHISASILAICFLKPNIVLNE